MSRTYNTRDVGCVQAATHILGDKWTPILLNVLTTQGPQRFGALHLSVHGISPRTLSARLTKLESQGILIKKVYAEVPPHTEYALTEKGADLIPILELMAKWGKKHPPKDD